MSKRRKFDKYIIFCKTAIKVSLPSFREHKWWILGWKVSRNLQYKVLFPLIYTFAKTPKSEGVSMLSASLHTDFVQIVIPCSAIYDLAQGGHLCNLIDTGWDLYISHHKSLSNKHFVRPSYIMQHAI